MNPIEIIQSKINAANLWAKEIELKRGQYLKVMGSTDTNLYYVISGSLRIFFEDEYEERIIRLAYQGNLIGALDSFISEQPSELYIQTLKKTHLKVISKTAYLDFIHASSENLLLWQKNHDPTYL